LVLVVNRLLKFPSHELHLMCHQFQSLLQLLISVTQHFNMLSNGFMIINKTDPVGSPTTHRNYQWLPSLQPITCLPKLPHHKMILLQAYEHISLIWHSLAPPGKYRDNNFLPNPS
jgi:hypothetical protein